MSLVGALQAEERLTAKKRLVAEYIYNNHLPAEYKDSVTVNDLMETSQVEAIAKDGGKLLFIDLAGFRIYKGSPENALKDFNAFAVQQDLAKKGYKISDIRETVEVHDDFEPTLTDDDIKQLAGNNASLRINTNEQPTVGVIKTDPAVKKFLKKILKK